MNLASIPATQPFLDTLAEHWLARDADPSRGLILLPTRRSARALAEAFLRAGNGRPMLLPRISALGALDETPLALAGALDLPPAVPATQRLAALTRLILQWPPVGGGVMALDAAWREDRDHGAILARFRPAPDRYSAWPSSSATMR